MHIPKRPNYLWLMKRAARSSHAAIKSLFITCPRICLSAANVQEPQKNQS